MDNRLFILVGRPDQIVQHAVPLQVLDDLLEDESGQRGVEDGVLFDVRYLLDRTVILVQLVDQVILDGLRTLRCVAR